MCRFQLGLLSLCLFDQLAFSAALPPTADAFAQTIAGRYGHYDVVAYQNPTPLGDMRTLVITYGFTDFRVEGDRLIESETFCHATHKSNLPMKSSVNDKFTQAIKSPAVTVTPQLIAGTWQIDRPESPTPIGIAMPADETLPTDPKDPRVIDADQDGHPGVTVDVSLLGGLFKGQIYLARRERFAYHLSWNPEDGGFRGEVTDASEQLVVGASHEFLNKPNAPLQVPDLSLSPIQLVRLDEAYDCERLMEERDLLFPPEPKI